MYACVWKYRATYYHFEYKYCNSQQYMQVINELLTLKSNETLSTRIPLMTFKSTMKFYHFLKSIPFLFIQDLWLIPA